MEPARFLGVEVRHLAALAAVAEHGSFGAAAESLGYTQSAISQQIATLERMVGQRLIDRPGGPRRVSLTEAGELLRRHGDAIMARLSAAHADLTALANGDGGQLRVGTFQSVGTRLVPTLMRRFHEAWPRVEIRLTESHVDEELLGMVETGELDLAFTVLPLPDGPLEAVEILHDPYFFIVPAGSPLASKERVTMRDLDAESFIGYRHCRASRAVETARGPRGKDLDVVFRSDDNGTIQAMVRSGMGIALMPSLAFDPNDPEVVAISPSPALPQRVIALAWHADRHQSTAADTFVEMARLVAEEVALDDDVVAA
jgi:DNA-binding transcriptional LysR family regulator